MSPHPKSTASRGMIWGLQRRLLVMLLFTLSVIGTVSVLVHYQTAGTAALQQDQRLHKLVPLLADSIVVTSVTEGDAGRAIAGLSEAIEGPGMAMLLAPPVEEFLSEWPGLRAFGVFDARGGHIMGERWLPTVLPATQDAEFFNVVEAGTTYRVVAQRVTTDMGELIVMLADGSDVRQHWLGNVLLRVLFPNLMLFAVAAAVVTWGVARTLRPLIDLKDAVENRSPRDLSPLSTDKIPGEVLPLVVSLNRLFKLVNAQSEAQRRFVADAAHQLRTPLAGLQAQVEAWAQATRGMGGDESIGLRVDQVRRLRDATRRTSQLASQLLALSRADAVSADAQPMHRVDLMELCENMLSLYLDAAGRKHIDLGLEVQPAQTLGHAWLLRELLLNLVDNAVKYTPVGGRITVRCGEEPVTIGEIDTVRAWMEVEDDGPGIPAHEHERVLQRFYRVPGTTVEGNGLGLAIANEIARAHRVPLQFDTGAHGPGLRVRVTFEAVTY
ncbi:ATP-binding protein [Hydrogenophaga sp. 2FB]|uniref:ATP-binding protein n=1 Tax=Hydrogenophaga sp. 2FB TaxID=2502187 RepID=UPI00207BB695|nr:ATP-binding protein [Hydrogenophaga sp. 2FB]